MRRGAHHERGAQPVGLRLPLCCELTLRRRHERLVLLRVNQAVVRGEVKVLQKDDAVDVRVHGDEGAGPTAGVLRDDRRRRRWRLREEVRERPGRARSGRDLQGQTVASVLVLKANLNSITAVPRNRTLYSRRSNHGGVPMEWSRRIQMKRVVGGAARE